MQTEELRIMDVVQVKNGDEVPRIMVAVTMLSLRSLMRDNSIALYELLESCRDRQHVLFGNTPQVLSAAGLIEAVNDNGSVRIHDCVRSIVLSVVNGEGLDLTLSEPI